MVDDGRQTDGRRTDGRTTEHGYTISSPCEPDGSGELKMFEYYGDIHVYCPGVGAYEPLGPNFFQNINIQSYCPFPARLSL